MRHRGRKIGEKRGEGAVQMFVKRRGGSRYLKRLYGTFQSADAIARYITEKHNFYCCGNTIRNMMRLYRIPLNRTGGDRRSRTHCQFMHERESRV